MHQRKVYTCVITEHLKGPGSRSADWLSRLRDDDCTMAGVEDAVPLPLVHTHSRHPCRLVANSTSISCVPRSRRVDIQLLPWTIHFYTPKPLDTTRGPGKGKVNQHEPQDANRGEAQEDRRHRRWP
jgi:hypothetical protein